MKRIIVADTPDQQFALLTDGGVRFTMRLRYNVSTDRWSFDIAHGGVWVLRGRRIVTGIDLMAGTGIDTFGMIFAYSASGAEPDRNNLPSGAVALYIA